MACNEVFEVTGNANTHGLPLWGHKSESNSLAARKVGSTNEVLKYDIMDVCVPERVWTRAIARSVPLNNNNAVSQW